VRRPGSVELGAAAGVLRLAFGLRMGVWAGLKPRTLLQRVAMAFALLGVAIPTFWAGVMLVLVFSGIFHWLPPIGRGPTTLIAGVPVNFLSLDGWRHLAMPALSLSLGTLALFIRL